MPQPRNRNRRYRSLQVEKPPNEKPFNMSPVQVLARHLGELTGDHLARVEREQAPLSQGRNP